MFETQVTVTDTHKGMMVVDFISLFFRGHVARHAGGCIVVRNIRFFIEEVNVSNRETLGLGTMRKTGNILLRVHVTKGYEAVQSADEMVRASDAFLVTQVLNQYALA